MFFHQKLAKKSLKIRVEFLFFFNEIFEFLYDFVMFYSSEVRQKSFIFYIRFNF